MIRYMKPRPRQWALEIYTHYLLLRGRRKDAQVYAIRFWLKRKRRLQHPLQCPFCCTRQRYGNPALPAGQGPLCVPCQEENAPIIRRLSFTKERLTNSHHFSHEH